MNEEQIVITFGKYKGKSVSDLPLDYCQWLYDNVTLYGKVANAISARLGHEPPPTRNYDLVVKEVMARMKAKDESAARGEPLEDD